MRRRVSAQVELSGVEVVIGVVVDMSEGGLCVLVEEPLPIRDRCVVRVHGWEDTCMVALAEVVWSSRRRHGWQLGLKFVEIAGGWDAE